MKVLIRINRIEGINKKFVSEKEIRDFKLELCKLIGCKINDINFVFYEKE